MIDYSEQIEDFRDEKVRLSAEFLKKLLAHRKANRDRLISRLPAQIPGVTIGESSFKPQGSVAMGTVIQTKFVDEEYDIDDGLVLLRDELTDGDGGLLGAIEVKTRAREALKDDRFKRQPKLQTNCVRVFYAEEDAEKHHVDFPVYRTWEGPDGNKVRELASEDSWVPSDPTKVNSWFDREIADRNKAKDGRGTQFRQLIQLLKRFCRSRKDWDLPNGMKLTMLVAECQPPFSERIDVAFRELLKKLQGRLEASKVIRNLAAPGTPAITRTDTDRNVCDLLERVSEALRELEVLDDEDADVSTARRAWEWVFKSDGFFEEYDKRKGLLSKAAQIASGARTSAAGVIGAVGVPNQPHRFYGEE